MSRAQASWFAYQLPPALAGGSGFLLIWALAQLVRLKPEIILQADHALKCVAIDKTAIEKGVTAGATARMTDDCQKGIAKFLEK
mgnify:CR=1 FL=1